MPVPSHICREHPDPLRPRRIDGAGARPRRGRTGGFTLMEVVLAAGILAISAAGIVAALMQAYYTAAEVRYRDEARFVLRSFADQFLLAAAQDSTGQPKTMWVPTIDPTGTGLVWKGTAGSSASLHISLGPNSSSHIDAYVKRAVRYVSITAPNIGDQISTAPTGKEYMVSGQFSITYTVPLRNRPHQYSISVIRCVP